MPLTFFEQILMEADTPPPDIEDSGNIEQDNNPPDIDNQQDQPNEMFSDNMGDQDMEFDQDNQGDQQNQPENIPLDKKISTILNESLYRRFLILKDKVTNHLSMITNNADTIQSLVPTALDILTSLKKLQENIELYLTRQFTAEDYSVNLLFYNKCINYISLLDDNFATELKKAKNHQ